MYQESIVASSWVNVFTGSTGTSSAPSASTDGIAVPKNCNGKNTVLRLRHTATGARTATITLWGYCAGEVTTAGVAVAGSAGWDDTGESYSLASTSTDGSVTVFVTEALTVYSRIYVRITAISGTSCTLGCAAAFTDEG